MQLAGVTVVLPDGFRGVVHSYRDHYRTASFAEFGQERMEDWLRQRFPWEVRPCETLARAAGTPERVELIRIEYIGNDVVARMLCDHADCFDAARGHLDSPHRPSPSSSELQQRMADMWWGEAQARARRTEDGR